MAKTSNLQKALFAAGCFWGVQHYFDQIPGVKTTAGYTGGHTENPTYDDVCSHTTGHAEAVLIEFDPKKVSYRTLLRHFSECTTRPSSTDKGRMWGIIIAQPYFILTTGRK